MTTLNMDIDIADQAVARMVEAYNMMTDEAKRIRAQIYGILQDGGNWMGLSAKDFFEKFNETDQNIHAQLTDFEQLGIALREEVAQWKLMQEHLQ